MPKCRLIFISIGILRFLQMHSAVDQHGIQLHGRMRHFLVSRKLTNLCEEAQLLLTEHVALADKVNSFQLQLVEKSLFCASILLQGKDHVTCETSNSMGLVI